MKFRNREISVFSISALDLFASALGAFILIAIVLMPYFLGVDRQEVDRLRQAVAQAETAEAATRERLRQSEAGAAEARRRMERAQAAEAATRERLRQSEAREAEARRRIERAQAAEAATRERLRQSEAGATEARRRVEQARAAEAATRERLRRAEAREAEARRRIERVRAAEEGIRTRLERIRGTLAQCEETRADCGRRVANLERDRAGLQQCRAELNACSKRLSRTFLAVLAQWSTEDHDIDLHIVDTAGKEFYFDRKRIRGRPGALSVDTRQGPGVEVWEVADAPAGKYRVLYNLYDQHGNQAPAIVNGGVYHRDGHDRFGERRLTVVGRRVPVAVVTVREDGSVLVSRQ